MNSPGLDADQGGSRPSSLPNRDDRELSLLPNVARHGRALLVATGYRGAAGMPLSVYRADFDRGAQRAFAPRAKHVGRSSAGTSAGGPVVAVSQSAGSDPDCRGDLFRRCR
ncbi:hypothetical protein MPLB_1690051 [Mesorhizobium sp. ORS 3324]|nr:hypothetical protein MPLB_1690051 [Mesorhizobium sp. ORS 3324]